MIHKKKNPRKKAPSEREVDPAVLGAALRVARIAAGMARKDVWERVSKLTASKDNDHYLYLIESGRRTPRPALLEAICTVLGTTPEAMTSMAEGEDVEHVVTLAKRLAELDELRTKLSAELEKHLATSRPKARRK